MFQRQIAILRPNGTILPQSLYYTEVNAPTAELKEQCKNNSEPIRKQILNVKRQMILLREARDRLIPKTDKRRNRGVRNERELACPVL